MTNHFLLKFKTTALLFLCLIVISACSKKNGLTPDDSQKTNKAILAFVFNSIAPAVNGDVNDGTKTVTVFVPNGTDVSALVPTISISQNASISPASGVATNFSTSVIYTVTAQDGSSQKYTVNVIKGKSNLNKITSFVFGGLDPAVTAVIDTTAKTITASIPAGIDITKLVPTITLSDNATVSPASGAAANFSIPLVYAVTAQDGTIQKYTVTVKVKSTLNKITSFVFAGLDPAVTAVIDTSAKTITATIPAGLDITKLVATIKISDNATVSPASGVAQDFSKDVSYVVKAENGNAQTYKVSIKQNAVPLADLKIQWQKTYGGSGADVASAIELTSDGGYIVVGATSSKNGDATGNHGQQDAFVAKLSSTGVIQWKKVLGGTQVDSAGCVKQTPDGGYMIGGLNSSGNGDAGTVTSPLTGVNVNYGVPWIIKLNAQGDIQWQRSYALSSSGGCVTALELTSDNGFVFSFNGHSPTRSNHSGFVIKCNTNGDVIWTQELIGSPNGYITDMKKTADDGYVICGAAYASLNNDKLQLGANDFYIVKLNNKGEIIWQKTYGGTGRDMARSICATVDNSYVVTGFSDSNDGDVSGHHGTAGSTDIWVLKIDVNGNKIWQESFGGVGDDVAFSVIPTSDNNYIIAGSTSSTSDVYVTTDYFSTTTNGWLIKINGSGELQWQKTIGGSKYDAINCIRQMNDGFILACTSVSVDGDVSGNNGNIDMWVVKLVP